MCLLRTRQGCRQRRRNQQWHRQEQKSIAEVGAWTDMERIHGARALAGSRYDHSGYKRRTETAAQKEEHRIYAHC